MFLFCLSLKYQYLTLNIAFLQGYSDLVINSWIMSSDSIVALLAKNSILLISNWRREKRPSEFCVTEQFLWRPWNCPVWMLMQLGYILTKSWWLVDILISTDFLSWSRFVWIYAGLLKAKFHSMTSKDI